MRDIKKKADDSEQIRVLNPKFKNGEACIRDIRIAQNFDYVEEFYQTYLEAENAKHLGAAANELQDQSPLPMNSMLQKEDRPGRKWQLSMFHQLLHVRFMQRLCTCLGK